MTDISIRDITVDDVPVRLKFSHSKMCDIAAGLVSVYIDGIKVLTLYKPTEAKMLEKVRRAMAMCDLPRPRCADCGEVMLVHSLGADCVYCDGM